MIKRFASFSVFPLAVLVAPQTLAQEKSPPSSLTVAELFTSQSCSSCPAAEEYFAQLAEDENLLTLEWHVDYWDQLMHRGSRWKDVYSSPVNTARQRIYNDSMRGTDGVYTPQAIINGRVEDVGSRKGMVEYHIENVKPLTLPVSIQSGEVSVAASDKPLDVLFVRLLDAHVTSVKGGENKGRTLSGKNIVLEAVTLGQSGQTAKTFTLPKTGQGESCAVIVQYKTHNELGPIMGAAKC